MLGEFCQPSICLNSLLGNCSLAGVNTNYFSIAFDVPIVAPCVLICTQNDKKNPIYMQEIILKACAVLCRGKPC